MITHVERLVLCLLNGWCFVAPRLAWGEARGGSIPRSGAVTDEQRSHRPTWGQPEGRQFLSVQASLLAPYRSTSGYARRSRLAWTENPLPQNTSHLGDTTLGLRVGKRVGFQGFVIRPASGSGSVQNRPHFLIGRLRETAVVTSHRIELGVHEQRQH